MTTNKSLPAAGFSLVELMVAMTISLLLVAGMTTIFANASRSSRELAEMNRQMENGRFALQMLRENLQHAGFWGELRAIPAPTAMVDPCTAYTAWGAVEKADVLGLPVQGYANGAGLPVTCALTARKASTDVLVVRQVATCEVGTTDCAAGQLAMQVSLCSNDPLPDWRMEAPGDANFVLTRPDSANRLCTNASYVSTDAPQRRVISNLYYVREHANTAGDGIPTLMRMEPNGAGAQPLVEGIEFLNVEYGIDNAGNDGVPDVFVTNTAAMTLADWTNVVVLRVHVLARNLQRTPGYVDGKTYTLAGVNVGPFNDNFKRHVYRETIRLTNPAARRAP